MQNTDTFQRAKLMSHEGAVFVSTFRRLRDEHRGLGIIESWKMRGVILTNNKFVRHSSYVPIVAVGPMWRSNE